MRCQGIAKTTGLQCKRHVSPGEHYCKAHLHQDPQRNLREGDDVCPICIERVRTGRGVTMVCCGKTLHKCCFERMCDNAICTCPMCRAYISQNVSTSNFHSLISAYASKLGAIDGTNGDEKRTRCLVKLIELFKSNREKILGNLYLHRHITNKIDDIHEGRDELHDSLREQIDIAFAEYISVF